MQQKITELEQKNQELVNSLLTEQSDIKLYQEEVASLKSQVKLAQEGQENILNRFNANRDKQEKENDQVRETIKYLRDENSEMITQHNEKKEQFLEQIHELESKLTEYRLKFEYAQKQLSQNSETK
jgi:chromosome segregation ATPase